MKTIINIIVIVIILGLGWYFYQKGLTVPAASPSTATQTNENPQGPDYTPSSDEGSMNDTGSSASAPMTATVTHSASGFSPASVTIAKGDMVTFVDESGRGMWVASDVHPSHTLYDGTSKNEHCAVGYSGAAPFDQCGIGSSYSFTFAEAGTWQYHNHVGASEVGTIIVK